MTLLSFSVIEKGKKKTAWKIARNYYIEWSKCIINLNLGLIRLGQFNIRINVYRYELKNRSDVFKLKLEKKTDQTKNTLPP